MMPSTDRPPDPKRSKAVLFCPACDTPISIEGGWSALDDADGLECPNCGTAVSPADCGCPIP